MSESKKMPEEILAALEFLLQTAQKHGAVVAGFMFSSKEPYFMTNFGNCNDAGDPHFYARLCQIAEDKRSSGLSYHQSIGRPQ
jgi:hypothetical protein